ncbi:MAG: hypothetical protein RIT02_2178, partial [Planctomycetota bacterium]
GRGSCRAAGENQRVLLVFFGVGLFHHGKTRNTRKKEGVTVALFADAGLGRARLVARRGIQGRGSGFGSAGASPSQQSGQGSQRTERSSELAGVRLSGSFALPRIRARITKNQGIKRTGSGFGSAGASPSQGIRARITKNREIKRTGSGFGSAGASPSQESGCRSKTLRSHQPTAN